MGLFKTTEIKKSLKQILKTRKQKYSDLASHLDCSIPTVKRMLSSEEISLSRLLQICEFLDVNLTDLESMVKASKQVEYKFTEKQEVFLVNHKNYFAFLIEIYNGNSSDQIAKKYHLTDRSMQKYLMGLEKYDLIKVSGKNKVRPYYTHLPSLGRGPLGMAYYRSLIQNSSHFFTEQISDKMAGRIPNRKEIAEGFSIMTMNIDLQTYSLWAEEFKKKLSELGRISDFQEKTKNKDELKTAVFLFASSMVDKDYKGLDTLNKTFGEVTNIS